MPGANDDGVTRRRQGHILVKGKKKKEERRRTKKKGRSCRSSIAGTLHSLQHLRLPWGQKMARRLQDPSKMAPWNDIKERVFAFALALLRLRPRLAKLGPDYAHIAMQLFRAGSSLPAHLAEGEVFVSRKDKALKHANALREAKESSYWLRLTIASGVMAEELRPLRIEAEEFAAILSASVRKLRIDSDENG